MGELVRFYQKGFVHKGLRKSVLRERRFPLEGIRFLEVEIPCEQLPTHETRKWVGHVEREIRKMFAPFKSSPLSVGIDNDIVYIHIFIDNDLDDDEVADCGICLKKFLEEEGQIKIDTDYVTGDESLTDQIP